MSAAKTNPFQREGGIWEEALTAWRRRRLSMLLVFLATALSVYGYLSLKTEEYEAEARLLVKLGRENAEVPVTVEKGGVYASGVQKEEINSYIQLLTSRSLIEAAVDQVGLEAFRFEPPPPRTLLQQVKRSIKAAAKAVRNGYKQVLITLDLKKALDDREEVVLLVQKSLTVQREKDSNVISVQMRLPEPNLARLMVRTLLDLYMQRHVQIGRSHEVRDIFEQQAQSCREELERIEQQRSAVREQYRFSSASEERAHLLRRLHELRQRVSADQCRREELTCRSDALRKRLEEFPQQVKRAEVVKPNSTVLALKDRLTSLQLERAKLSSRYQEDSEPLRKIHEEIQCLRKELEGEAATQVGETTFAVHPIKEAYERELSDVEIGRLGLEASIKAINQQSQELEQAVRALDTGEEKLRRLDLERQVVEQRYVSNATRREEVRVAEQLDERRVANVAVLSGPTTSQSPVAPRKLLITAVGLVAGLVLATCFGLMLEYLDDRVYLPNDLSSIQGLECLGIFRVS
jgi:uncharacterized protein involved in exopolysaccharide biosynthesis